MPEHERPVLAAAESAMEFYDTWVARDSDGNMFQKQAPYVTDPYSLDRIAQGLPFPAKCCWNGMVILNSGPFLRHDARVRHAALPSLMSWARSCPEASHRSVSA